MEIPLHSLLCHICWEAAGSGQSFDNTLRTLVLLDVYHTKERETYHSSQQARKVKSKPSRTNISVHYILTSSYRLPIDPFREFMDFMPKCWYKLVFPTGRFYMQFFIETRRQSSLHLRTCSFDLVQGLNDFACRLIVAPSILVQLFVSQMVGSPLKFIVIDRLDFIWV